MDVPSTSTVCAAEKTNLRIVLLGKTGVGKSSAGNIILGTKAFESHPSFCSVTSVCEKKTDDFRDLNLDVIDTPGLFGTKKSNEKVVEEITRCISMVAPGPHVFLIVLQPTRFTEEDKETLKIIKKTFGEEAARYTMVLFTNGDELKKRNINIEDMLEKHQPLKHIISQCSNLDKFEDKYHVFYNNVEDSAEVRGLVQKIQIMVRRNGGSYYSKEMVKRAKQEEMERPLRAAVAAEKEPELRIVLVGKTGVGKSAAGNTILGRKAFRFYLSVSSVTSFCTKEQNNLFGLNLVVIDTPGLFDTDKSNNEVCKDFAECVCMATPGPHVFLIVIQLSRFQAEEKETVEIIQKMFGEEAAKYTMILFTHGDELKKENIKIEDMLEKHQPLTDIISQCSILEKFEDKYHVFDNEVEDPAQVGGLMEKINRMVQRNGGSFYTSKMFVEAERANQEEIKRLLRENPNMNHQDARRQAERNNSFIRDVLRATAAGSESPGASDAFGDFGGLLGAALGAAIVAAMKTKGGCVIQ